MGTLARPRAETDQRTGKSAHPTKRYFRGAKGDYLTARNLKRVPFGLCPHTRSALFNDVGKPKAHADIPTSSMTKKSSLLLTKQAAYDFPAAGRKYIGEVVEQFRTQGFEGNREITAK